MSRQGASDSGCTRSGNLLLGIRPRDAALRLSGAPSSAGAHPVVPRVVLEFNEPQVLHHRRHVVREPPP